MYTDSAISAYLSTLNNSTTVQGTWPSMDTKPTKRKRNDSSVDTGHPEEIQRASKKTLVFRSLPSSKPPQLVTQHPAINRPSIPRFLTPVDSDDDLQFDDDFRPSRPNINGSQNNTDSISSSIRAVAGNTDKMDVFISPPHDPPSSSNSPFSGTRKLGRPRSNGMLGPPQPINSLSTQASSLLDRAPTPIHSYFPGDTDMEMSDTLPPRTVLSPMIDLPSPDEEMSDMHFENENREYSCSAPDRSADHSAQRTARLHMGFRADCEKCVQRVPGHYTHILWS